MLSTCNAMTTPTHDPSNYFTIDGKVDQVVFTYDIFWQKSAVEWSQVGWGRGAYAYRNCVLC